MIPERPLNDPGRNRGVTDKDGRHIGAMGHPPQNLRGFEQATRERLDSNGRRQNQRRQGSRHYGKPLTDLRGHPDSSNGDWISAGHAAGRYPGAGQRALTMPRRTDENHASEGFNPNSRRERLEKQGRWW